MIWLSILRLAVASTTAVILLSGTPGHAAGSVGQREEIGQVKAADHREMP